MADNIVGSLFGLTPEMYGEQQRTSALGEGISLAQLNPAARGAALTYAGAKGLGGAIGGAMGVQDPQLQLISARQSIAKQIDQTDPNSIIKGAQMLSQIGDIQGASALAQTARQMQSEMALMQQRQAAQQASLATAAKTQLSIEQEKQLRDELAKLPQNASQEDVLAIVTKYGSADKVLSALQASTDKAAQREQALQMQKERIAADIERARQAGADKKEIAQMQIQGRKALAMFAQSLKGPKTLTPSLQKEEDKEL